MINELYSDWLQEKKNLSESKKKELELRSQIIDSLITNETKGVFKFTEGGVKLTVGLGTRMNIDISVLDTLMSELSDQEKECVKYLPNLVAKEMKKLKGDELLFEAIIEKPSLPTLKIEIDD